MGVNIHISAEVYQRCTLRIKGVLHEADGTPLDLSPVRNPVIHWRVKGPDGSIVFDYTLGNGILILDAVNGEIYIEVADADTAQLAPGSYPDQLRVTVDAKTSMQWVGTITVKEAI